MAIKQCKSKTEAEALLKDIDERLVRLIAQRVAYQKQMRQWGGGSSPAKKELMGYAKIHGLHMDDVERVFSAIEQSE